MFSARAMLWNSNKNVRFVKVAHSFKHNTGVEGRSLRKAIEEIKEWKRSWKVELIEKVNPQWEDLYEQIVRNA